MNNSRGKNASHSQKVGQFDRSAFKASGERIFDQQFDFDRQLKETFLYANTQKKGSLQQRMVMHAEKERQDRSRKEKIAQKQNVVQQVQKQRYLKSDKSQKTYLKPSVKTNYLSQSSQQTSEQGNVPAEFLKKKKQKKRKNLGISL